MTDLSNSSFPDARVTVAPLLVVRDLPRSLAFYVDVLGATAVDSWESYAQLRLGSGRIHLVTPSAGTDDKPGVQLVPLASSRSVSGEVVIHVVDCRRVYDELAGRGVKFLAPPTEPPWGGEVRCFLQDPDGHLVEFSEITGSVDPH
jgi:catechol 2,3-dioxygenase-like lactoylglutathione lyase family enzyme